MEHIPIEERQLFLDQLLSKSKYGLIFLNPFYIDGSHVEDRLKLVVDVTGAEWAKEHAREKNLQVSIRPNGTLTTTLALVFVNYFYSKFFNVKFDNNVLDTEKYPTGYIVYLGWADKQYR